MRCPSGDHAGCRSAYASFVSVAASAAVQVVDEQIGEAARHPGEADGVAVGRPGRVEDLVDARESDLALASPLRASKIASAGRPDDDRANAIRLLVASQAPAE